MNGFSRVWGEGCLQSMTATRSPHGNRNEWSDMKSGTQTEVWISDQNVGVSVTLNTT